MEMDVEKVIDFLKNQKEVKLKEMMVKLGVDRGGFLSWRRSSNPGRREEMARKLKEAYPQHFQEQPKENPEEKVKTIENRYLTLLEKNLQEVTAERDQLKAQVLQLLQEIKAEIKKKE